MPYLALPCANASSLSGGPTVVRCLLSKTPHRDLAASTTQAPSAAHSHPGRELSAFPCQCPPPKVSGLLLPCTSTAPRQYREPREKKVRCSRVFLQRYVGTADYSTCVAGSALDVCSDGPPCQRLPKLISGTIRHCSPHSPITSYNISLLLLPPSSSTPPPMPLYTFHL